MDSKREKKALHDEIRNQFLLGTKGVRTVGKDLFLKGQTNVLNASILEQKYWVRTLKISRAYVEEAEKNIFIGMRHLLRTWTRPPD